MFKVLINFIKWLVLKFGGKFVCNFIYVCVYKIFYKIESVRDIVF